MCANLVCHFIFNGLGDTSSATIMPKGNVRIVISCVTENPISHKVMVAFCLLYQR